MLDEPFNKIHSRDSLLCISVIFMAAVMEGDVFAIVSVNAGSGSCRLARVSANILRGFGLDNHSIPDIGLPVLLRRKVFQRICGLLFLRFDAADKGKIYVIYF